MTKTVITCTASVTSVGGFDDFGQAQGDVTIFLDPEGGSQNATLVVVVLVVVGISSLKIPKAFLIRRAAQLNFAYTIVLIFPTDLPSQIFKLISN